MQASSVSCLPRAIWARWSRISLRGRIGRVGSRSSASILGSIRRLAGGSRALGERLGGESFCATYADGVADIDLDALLEFHRGQGFSATVTVVQPHLQWGVAKLGDDGMVEGFVEKPRSEHWINGGFFCFEPGRARLHRRGQRARARAAGAPGGRRPAARLSSRGLLGLHGHLQGRGRAQRSLGARRAALDGSGRGGCGRRR